MVLALGMQKVGFRFAFYFEVVSSIMGLRGMKGLVCKFLDNIFILKCFVDHLSCT